MSDLNEEKRKKIRGFINARPETCFYIVEALLDRLVEKKIFVKREIDELLIEGIDKWDAMMKEGQNK